MKTSYLAAIILISMTGFLAAENDVFADFEGNLQDLETKGELENGCSQVEELEKVVENGEVVGSQKLGSYDSTQYLQWKNWKELGDQRYEVGKAGNWSVYGKRGIPAEGKFDRERGYYLELDCHKGSSEGENVNHLYCDIGSGLTKSGLKMRKTVIGEDGEIKEKTTRAVEKVVYDSERNVVSLTCN